MKRVLLSLIAFLIGLVLVPVVKAEEKVPVYMISKNGCSACEAATQYFNGLQKQYPDLFDLVELQVFDSSWGFVSTDLQNMFVAIYEKIGEDTSKAATPTIVIGDYHTIGIPQDTDEIYDAIITARDAKNKVDIVKDLADYLNIDLNSIRLGTNTETKETGKYDTIIIISIFVVLVGGFAGLVFASKK